MPKINKYYFHSDFEPNNPYIIFRVEVFFFGLFIYAFTKDFFIIVPTIFSWLFFIIK